jgi:hypothetical protein
LSATAAINSVLFILSKKLYIKQFIHLNQSSYKTLHIQQASNVVLIWYPAKKKGAFFSFRRVLIFACLYNSKIYIPLPQ